MSRTPFHLQMTAADCGPAVLGMVLGRYRRLGSLAGLRDELDVGRDGMRMLDLKREAAARGLEVRALAVDRDERVSGTLRQLRLPLIAHWDGDHYVVVDALRARRIHLLDPAVGRRWVDVAEFNRHATGAVLDFRPEGQVTTTRAPSPVSRVLRPLARDHWFTLALVVGLSLLGTGFGLIVPFMTSALVGGVVTRGSVSITLTVILAVFAAIAVTAAARVQLVSWIQRDVGIDLSVATVSRLLSARQTYVDRRLPGDLLERVHTATRLRDLLLASLGSGAVNAIFLVVYLTILIVIAPRLGLLTLVVAAAQMAVAILASRRTFTLRSTEINATAQGADELISAFEGFESIRATSGEDQVLARWRRPFDLQVDASYRIARITGLAGQLLLAVQLMFPLVVIWLVMTATTAGVDFAIVTSTLAGMTLGVVPGLVTLAFNLSQVAPLSERLDDALRTAADDDDTLPEPEDIQGRVELRRVTFRHDRWSPPTLVDVSLAVQPGEKLGIIGPSGSGKSTLAKLIAGMYRPTDGTVLVDGADLSTIRLSGLRDRLGVVFQDHYLASGSIRDALVLGHPDDVVGGVDDAAIVAALRIAGIDQDVAAMPLGLDTRITSRGTGLSGGQRQRLAIAQALLRRPAILILDEATSNIDPETEKMIEDRMAELPMTRVVISHRPSAVLDADHVVVLEHGRIVESGPPESLLGRDTALARFAASAS